jgi:hypothetical protein
MQLCMQLLSDGAFGRGDGIAGLVDSEVEHDPLTGTPLIKGRTVKGLLVESCADVLYALKIGANSALVDYEQAALKLFGQPGSTIADTGCLHVGPALLPEDLRRYLVSDRKRYGPEQVLQALTTIRHQTAVDSADGKPKDGSLRATRVVLRETIFYAHIDTTEPLSAVDLQLVAACAAGIKRGGQSRTRGLGRLLVRLVDYGEASSSDLLADFIQHIGGAA